MPALSRGAPCRQKESAPCLPRRRGCGSRCSRDPSTAPPREASCGDRRAQQRGRTKAAYLSASARTGVQSLRGDPCLSQNKRPTAPWRSTGDTQLGRWWGISYMRHGGPRTFAANKLVTNCTRQGYKVPPEAPPIGSRAVTWSTHRQRGNPSSSLSLFIVRDPGTKKTLPGCLIRPLPPPRPLCLDFPSSEDN